MQNHAGAKRTRAAAQISMLSRLIPGDIVEGTVVRTEREAVWIDLGGLVPACLPAERIALSPDPMQTARFEKGQSVLAAVLSIHRDTKTIYLTHYELLGSFAENTAPLAVGQKVTGRWLSPRQIELAPNLWGEAAGRVTPALYARGMEVEAEILALDRKNAVLTLRPMALLLPEASPEGQRKPGQSIRYFQTKGRLLHWAYTKAEPPHPWAESIFFVHPARQTTP